MSQSTATPGPRRVVNRDRDRTAPVRCACYAAYSELTASPHDLDPRPALADKIGVGANLDYGSAMDALLAEFVGADLDRLKSEYSGLFEVGSQGPPVPIREDLQTGQRAGVREDLVRFYDYFGYKLDEKFAWAPDHLSVELEFMHFLCYREASSQDDALSFQLAQADFADRHLVTWLPKLAESVYADAPGSLYSRVVRGVSEFVAKDLAWQQETITSAEEGPADD